MISVAKYKLYKLAKKKGNAFSQYKKITNEWKSSKLIKTISCSDCKYFSRNLHIKICIQYYANYCNFKQYKFYTSATTYLKKKCLQLLVFVCKMSY